MKKPIKKKLLIKYLNEICSIVVTVTYYNLQGP